MSDPDPVKEMKEAFSVKDAIMDVQIDEKIERFAEKGVTLEQMVDALCASYYGMSQVCNVMAQFLEELGDPVPVKKRKKTRRNAAQQEEEEEKAIQGLFFGKKEAETCVEDTLASLIIKNFTSDLADSIFEDEADLNCLPKLIAHQRWRKMLYVLMEQNPSCLMLNFTVKLISDAGYQNEICTVSTVAQQMDIFSRVFLTQLASTVQKRHLGETSPEFLEAMATLTKVVCQGHHTFVYALCLLKSVARKTKGIVKSCVLGIIDELFLGASANRTIESDIIRIALSHSNKDSVDGGLIYALLTMTSKEKLNPTDVALIYEHYILPFPPPIELIREPGFQRMLLDALFTMEGLKNSYEQRDKYVYLLAYTASVTERIKSGQRIQMRAELDLCRDDIDRAISYIETPEDLPILLLDVLDACHSRVVAAGMLHYVQSVLAEEERIGDVPNAIFVIIDQISSMHPVLQIDAFNVCCDYYIKVSKMLDLAEIIMGRQRLIIDRFVHLLSVGAALQVIERMHEMYEDNAIDASLVRYFVLEVLDIISPPYSPKLVQLLLPLVANNEIIDQVRLEKCPLAIEFIQHCAAEKA